MLQAVVTSVVIGILGAWAISAQSHEIDFEAGYNYQNSDQGKGVRADLNGWFGSLQYDLNELVGITAEVDTYYGTSQGHYLRQQNYVIGPQFTFRSSESKLRPFVSVQAGDQRSSSVGAIGHAFDLQIGGGLQVRLNHRLSIQFTPVQYNLASESGTATHSYSASVGFIWTLWKQK
jgi:hypothetical protein